MFLMVFSGKWCFTSTPRTRAVTAYPLFGGVAWGHLGLKVTPKCIINLHHFFDSILDRFWLPNGFQKGAKMVPKPHQKVSSEKTIKNVMKFIDLGAGRSYKNSVFHWSVCSERGFCYVCKGPPKRSQKPSKTHPKFIKNR